MSGEYSNILVTAPAVEPVSLALAKAHLRIGDSAAEDELINLYIATARETIENITKRALITQTWKRVSSELGNVIELTRPPLISVSSIKVYAYDGTAETAGATTYQVMTTREPGRIILEDGEVWPDTDRTQDAYEIIYTCGYGGTADYVPKALRTAVLMMVARLFENRGDSDAALNDKSINQICSRYRIPFVV